MRRFFKLSLLLFIGFFLIFPSVISAKTVKKSTFKPVESKKIIHTNTKYSRLDSKLKSNCDDFEDSSDLKTNNISINFSSYDVIPKAMEVKKRIMAEFPEADMDQFNASETGANMRFVLPLGAEDKISDLFSDDPELTQFNKSSCNYRCSYSDSNISYKTYKILLDNIDDIIKMLKSKTKCPIDEYKIKQMLESQVRSYESSMIEYQKQLKSLMLQVYVSRKDPKK